MAIDQDPQASPRIKSAKGYDWRVEFQDLGFLRGIECIIEPALGDFRGYDY